MSNVDRPRTGLKSCPHCGSTDRDSNGQCACRNNLYRLVRKNPDSAEQVKETYGEALGRRGGTVEKAVAAVRAAFPSATGRQPADKKAPAKKKAAAKKAASKRVTPAEKKAQVEKAEQIIEDETAKAQARAEADPARYTLVVKDDWTDPKDYARKDAAIKNGVRSGEAWEVTYKGKVVAQSDDLL